MKFENDIPDAVTEVRQDQKRRLGQYEVLGSWSMRSLGMEQGFREHAPRDLSEFASTDTDWGEQDSLANVPRRKIDPTIRAAITPGDEGDR